MERDDGSVMDATGKADVLVNKPFYLCAIMRALEKTKGMVRSRARVNDETFEVGMSFTEG